MKIYIVMNSSTGFEPKISAFKSFPDALRHTHKIMHLQEKWDTPEWKQYSENAWTSKYEDTINILERELQ